MKKVLKLSGYMSIALIMHSCTPDMDFTTGEPQSRIEQLKGTWRLESVTQTDVNARDNNYIDFGRPDLDVVKMDITSAAPFTDITLSLEEDASNTPTAFSINYGNAPKIFRHTTGTWNVDNISAPGQIKLINGTDTVSVKIGSVNNLISNKITLQQIKYQNSKPKIQYDYNFKKN